MWWLISGNEVAYYSGDVVTYWWRCGDLFVEMWWLVCGDLVASFGRCGDLLVENGDVVAYCFSGDMVAYL